MAIWLFVFLTSVAQAEVLFTPAAETQPVESAGDVADDPAIWINHQKPGHSLIFGTDKESGLALYDLGGRLKKFFDIGAVNNVDVLQDVLIGPLWTDIVTVSNKSNHSLEIYTFDGSHLNLLHGEVAPKGKKVYGICLGASPVNGRVYAFISVKDKGFYQYEIRADRSVLVRTYPMASTAEGCVVDNFYDSVWITEEEVGVWRLPLNPDSPLDKELVVPIAPPRIVPDLEGVALLEGPGGSGRIVVSVQGNSSFALLDRATGRFIDSARVTANRTIDEVSDTDGLDITTYPLGDQFPRGVMVVQDGENTDQRGRSLNQNFKIIGL